MNMLPPFNYDTIDHVLEFKELRIKMTCITNFDDLLNRLIEKGEDHEDFVDERLPYWADLWHSAIAMAKYLVDKKLVLPKMKVTEIGCGLGLPGIVAGKIGADVTLTDYLPETLEFLKNNWSQNISSPLKAQLLDWRNPDPKFRADLLLASDVAYEERSFDALLPALKTLSKSGSRIILTEPSRAIAKPFLEQLKNDSDFQLTQSVLEVKWNDFYKKINVLDLVRL